MSEKKCRICRRKPTRGPSWNICEACYQSNAPMPVRKKRKPTKSNTCPDLGRELGRIFFGGAE